MNEYIRLSENYNKNKLIPINDSPYKYVKDKNSPYFISMMKYNQDQFDNWKKSKSLAGLSGGTTNKIWADFDCKENLETAFDDCLVFVRKLLDLGFTEEDVQVSFSGSKGAGVLIENTEEHSIEEVKAFCTNLAKDLKTFDHSMYDHQRIFRLLFTKNEKTGLYKIPLNIDELENLTIDEIKGYASDLDSYDIDFYFKHFKKAKVTLPKELLLIEEKDPPKIEVSISDELDETFFKDKPKHLDNSRWALQNGFFQHGERNHSFLCLAATYKNLGYKQEHVYRMLKGVAEIQAERYDEERFSDTELYNNVVTQVFSDRWKNGQYTIRDKDSWLYNYCIKYNIPMETEEERKIVTFDDIHSGFSNFVENIDKNRIHLGIDSLDDKLFITTGMMLQVIGAPGAGKTAMALNVLNNTSKKGIKTVLASLDMHRNRLYEKMLYKLTGYSREDLYLKFKNKEESKILLSKIKEEFGNISIFDRSSPTVQNIRDYVLQCEQESGEKVKLVLIDYFERLVSDINEDTAASKRIAGELQDFANDLDVCLIVLVQPNKFSLSGGPDKPILNYTAIKGSSFLYQSARTIISLWRPFFHPRWKDYDNYMSMAILKNDFGELDQFDFHWNGKKGEITELEDIERAELKDLLESKSQSDNSGGNGFDY